MKENPFHDSFTCNLLVMLTSSSLICLALLSLCWICCSKSAWYWDLNCGSAWYLIALWIDLWTLSLSWNLKNNFWRNEEISISYYAIAPNFLIHLISGFPMTTALTWPSVPLTGAPAPDLPKFRTSWNRLWFCFNSSSNIMLLYFLSCRLEMDLMEWNEI